MKNQFQVSALYHFVRLENFEALKQPLLDCMLANEVKGTLLLANEGINGTIAGTTEGIKAVFNHLNADPRLQDIRSKESFTDTLPFYRSKVKLKKEIVTMGVEGIDPRHVVGTYVKPENWNELISDPEVVVVDTRNDYEYQIGTFENAINPNTETFREFPDYVAKNLDPEKHKKVAMFCTGGIRCEKSTSYLKDQGFNNVYHLQGGILRYLETVAPEENLWEGECFVFDSRVSVDKNLEPGEYDQCFACRRPLSELDKTLADYQPGVSCAYCINEYSDTQRRRFTERQKQVQLAKKRGETHIGQAQPGAEEDDE